MEISLAIYGAPSSSQAANTAFRYAQAALAEGHRIQRLFFYLDGVHNATSLAAPPQDEIDLPARWQALINEHSIDAVVCVAAALRRGVMDQDQAQRHDRDSNNLATGFTISGLGQLVAAGLESDRLITFGA